MRLRLPSAAALVVFVALALQVVGANPAVSQTPVLTAFAAGDPGLDPSAPIWDAIPALTVPLTAQGQTYPTSTLTVPALNARAIVNRGVLYVRIDWADPTRDDRTIRMDQFADAAALEFPAGAAATVPAVCMGQADVGVNVWQWRADSEQDQQAAFDAAFPEGYADLPSALGDAGYTARVAGNPYAAQGVGSVQDLVAIGFGTLGPASSQAIRGSGTYADGTWKVVFARPLAGPGPDRPTFVVHTQTDLALAVWNGSNGDRNGRKMISSFVRLDLSNAAFPPMQVVQQGAPTVIWMLALAPFTAMLLFAAFAGLRAVRRRA